MNSLLTVIQSGSQSQLGSQQYSECPVNEWNSGCNTSAHAASSNGQVGSARVNRRPAQQREFLQLGRLLHPSSLSRGSVSVSTFQFSIFSPRCFHHPVFTFMSSSLSLSQVSCCNVAPVTPSSGSDSLVPPLGSSGRPKSLPNSSLCLESGASVSSHYPKAPGYEREDQVHGATHAHQVTGAFFIFPAIFIFICLNLNRFICRPSVALSVRSRL